MYTISVVDIAGACVLATHAVPTPSRVHVDERIRAWLHMQAWGFTIEHAESRGVERNLPCGHASRGRKVFGQTDHAQLGTRLDHTLTRVGVCTPRLAHSHIHALSHVHVHAQVQVHAPCPLLRCRKSSACQSNPLHKVPIYSGPPPAPKNHEMHPHQCQRSTLYTLFPSLQHFHFFTPSLPHFHFFTNTDILHIMQRQPKRQR
jgi:hypothetical protein